MIKRTLLLMAVMAGFFVPAIPEADAQVFVRRVAPVRRVAARAVFPPYPVARRAVVAPVYRSYYRPYYGGYYGGYGYGYGRPYGGWGYSPGISIGVGF